MRAYRYKIKPNKEQREKINTSLGASRFIYNHALARRIEEYDKDKRFLSDADLYKEINIMRSVVNLNDDSRDYSWMMDIPGQVIINSIRQQSTAFKNMIKHGYGFPRFKKKNRCRDSFTLFNPRNQLLSINFINHEIRLSKLGWIKFRPNEEFDLSSRDIRNVTVSRDSRDNYWISVMVDDYRINPPRAKVSVETSVGVDLGLIDFATLSTGEKIENPRLLERSLKRLAVLQRKMCRQKRGSRRRERTREKISRLHERTASKRKDFLHKLSRRLVDEFDTVCVEDLDIKDMIQRGELSRSISSVGWGMFINMLDYKSTWHGKNLLKVDRYYASSKTCNNCGYKTSGLLLSDRSWICYNCLETNDRDMNAALNIRDEALRNYIEQPVGAPGLTGMETEVTKSVKCSCMTIDNGRDPVLYRV